MDLNAWRKKSLTVFSLFSNNHEQYMQNLPSCLLELPVLGCLDLVVKNKVMGYTVTVACVYLSQPCDGPRNDGTWSLTTRCFPLGPEDQSPGQDSNLTKPSWWKCAVLHTHVHICTESKQDSIVELDSMFASGQEALIFYS